MTSSTFMCRKQCSRQPHVPLSAPCAAVPDSAFRDGWERWQDQDFETDFSALWFPAWMLIHEPEIAKLTPVPEAGNSPQAAFAVLRELTMGDSEEMKLRKQLQRLHPGLLASYLKRR